MFYYFFNYYVSSTLIGAILPNFIYKKTIYIQIALFKCKYVKNMHQYISKILIYVHQVIRFIIIA